jgi:hypothetical protein
MHRLVSFALGAAVVAAGFWVAAPGRAQPQEQQTILNVSDATPKKATTSTDCTFTVQRIGSLSRTTRVEFDTDSGRAKEDRHFTAAIGVLEFAADEASKTIVVDVIKQKFRHSDFTLRVFNPSSNTTIDDEEGFCVLKRR